MSAPCPLCGREKLKDRVARLPPMDDMNAYCLHPAHIYGRELPPCESAGVARIESLETALAARDETVRELKEMVRILAMHCGDYCECGIRVKTHLENCALGSALRKTVDK